MWIEWFSALWVKEGGALLRDWMDSKRGFDGLICVGRCERIDVREDLDLETIRDGGCDG